MFQPTFKTTTTESTANYGQIVIEPLEKGFGNTLGISLRRVLLEHIPGAAVTTVKIGGVNHQFTTLEGLKEDIVDLILNIKQIRVSYTGEEPAKATLKATGPGEITASQIEFSSGIELANPDLVLATLADKKTKLNIEFTVESGKGYSPAEDRLVDTLGIIPVDALFSPITKVNFHVTDTRVGRFTNYDKLTLDIWTDATISPENAVKQAANILKVHYQQIISPVEQPEEETPQTKIIEPEVFRITVEELELPTRIANALRKAKLGTVKDLVNAKKADISKIKNLGGKSVEIVEAAIKAKGVEFSE